MAKKGFTVKLESPIITRPGVDADQLGEHYAQLHDTLTGPAYSKLGEKVKTIFRKKLNPDGSQTVTLYEIHGEKES